MPANLLHAVQKRIANVPANPIIDSQPPREARLVEVDEQPHGQVPQLDILKVEARARGAEEGGQPRQQQCEIAEARDADDVWIGGGGGMRDVQRDPGVPERLGDRGGHHEWNMLIYLMGWVVLRVGRWSVVKLG